MTAQTTVAPKPKRTPVPMHGVDTPTLLATINAVGAQPSLGNFQFRAKNRWISGTHSRSTMSGFFGAGAEHRHKANFQADADHPAVLCGTDEAPAPVEWVLHALATCITGGIANIAAARGITLRSVESTVVGDIDLRGILGLSKEVRNGYTAIRASFAIDGDATREQLTAILEQAKARSAVFDIISKGVPTSIGFETGAKH
ncbi:MAG TPA: OsmC family protein [Stellaceae bacterium]|nr:OsmC family protein [Stellaceae bacterium]